MKFEELERESRIEKIEKDEEQIKSYLRRALRDISTAKANLSIDEEWAFSIAYHAMLRAGRALMQSMGYRPKGKEQHKTVVTFCEKILGGECKSLVLTFNRMRRKRHDFIYEPEKPIARREVAHSIKSAESFISRIIELIKENFPQIEFF